METIQIDILNPKIKKTLSKLCCAIEKLKAKSKDEILLDDTTKEIEQVRKSRYEMSHNN